MMDQELLQRCRNRNFDQIVVVVKDLFQEMAAMQKIKKVVPGDIRLCTGELCTGPGAALAYTEKRATYFYENINLCIVQPVSGETLYKKYLDRFGEGICCVRERVSRELFDRAMEKFRENHLNIAQFKNTDENTSAWIDLSDELGILFEIITEDSEKQNPLHTISEKIAQINITTPNVRQTIEKLVAYLEIGPWEVGRQCNATAHDCGFLVDGVVKDAEFDFLLAILVCGNIEWEVIEPVKGPLVYYDFLKRRGPGYHHVLQEIPQARWQQVIAQYEENDAPLACKGSLGPIDWCYMDTEDALHFYSELRSDAVMDRLPDGYVQYFYP